VHKYKKTSSNPLILESLGPHFLSMVRISLSDLFSPLFLKGSESFFNPKISIDFMMKGLNAIKSEPPWNG
jgi:hypothetical protein